MASLLLRLSNTVLDQGGSHIYDGILVKDDADTQLLLNLQNIAAQQSRGERLCNFALRPHIKKPPVTRNLQVQAMMNYK